MRDDLEGEVIVNDLSYPGLHVCQWSRGYHIYLGAVIKGFIKGKEQARHGPQAQFLLSLCRKNPAALLSPSKASSFLAVSIKQK